MPVQVWLEKVDGAVFGVADAVAALAAFAAVVANHAHNKYDTIDIRAKG